MTSATFYNQELDLVVGHDNLISIIRAKQYMPYFDQALEAEGSKDPLNLCTDEYMQKLAEIE